MAVENLKEKLAQFVSKEPSKWQEEAQFRADNRAGLKRSQAIALNILTRIDEMGISQKELAMKLNVSPQLVNKWVKGRENFGLETISKLEEALEMELLSISTHRTGSVGIPSTGTHL
jgi:ribosome-binding protein aMBF1 (putative translation factor)